MTRTLFAPVLAAVLLTGAPATSLAATDLLGADAFAQVVSTVLSGCPGAAEVRFVGGGSDAGEQALLDRRQEVAPMTRSLDAVAACQAPRPDRGSGLVVAQDAVTLVAGPAIGADACTSGVTGGTILPVIDRNALPGIQCPGCMFSQYRIADWRDALRVLLAGMHHDAGADLRKQDCNSDVRHALASAWSGLLGGASCASGACNGISHVWRPEDRGHTTETFLDLLGLPPTPAAVYCNGAGAGPFPDPPAATADLTDFLDLDPIRRPCGAQDQVCGPDGTLGLVLPVVVPDQLAQAIAFPTEPCSFGVFRFLKGPRFPGLCPGGTHQLFGKCFTPVTSAGSPSCINTTKNCPIFTPRETDCRAFNRLLRTPDGGIAHDQRGRELTGSFYRLRTTSSDGATACATSNGLRQIACLTQAASCSLGVTSLAGAQAGGVLALPIDGVAPTLDNVHRLAHNPNDPGAYPLTRNFYLNTLVGFGGLSSPEQGVLAGCFASPFLSRAGAQAADLIPVDGAPPCVDFDERQCGGTLFNHNACDRRAFDLCPTVDSVVASPLQTSVGGTVWLSATASDPDGPPPDLLWQASAGTLAQPTSAATLYTCTSPGVQTITVTAWDGRCDDTYGLLVTCLNPP